MAGDWIKFEIGTSDKPEVWAIAQQLEIDPDAVVGKLLRIWSWFDQHTENGNAPSVTKMLLDRNVGVTGFCNSLITVRWMFERDGYIEIPNFDRHNGKTAKSRAVTAKRVAAFKQGKREGNADDNAKGNADTVTEALPREEKRREDISNTNVLDKNTSSEPNGSKPPADDSPIFISIPTNKHNTTGEEKPITEKQIHDWQIAYPAVDVRRVLAQIRSWVINNPAKRKTAVGINRFVDSWLAREQNRGGNHATNQSSSRPSTNGLAHDDTSWAQGLFPNSGGGNQPGEHTAVPIEGNFSRVVCGHQG